MKKLFIGLVCVLAGVACASVASGQILAFEFSALAGNEVTAGSASNDVNLTASTISRGAGLTASANAGRFNATAWALTSIANAVSGNNYMEFTITPQSGYQFSVSSIYVQWQRSATGNTEISLRSSADNYASDLDSNWTLTDNTSTQNKTWTFTQGNSTNPVTYRLYSYAEAAGGSGGPGDGTGNDIVVSGTVTPAGPLVFGVTVDKTDGFEVEEGTSEMITATAANGTPPYGYSWSSTLGGAYYSLNNNVFTILDTAPIGDYSATVTATDDASEEAQKTVTFSVVAPAQKYAINITAPVNGTVTTDPATEAEAGTSVVINPTPAGGYAVGTITVVGADTTPITVVSRTFTMPAQAVTVTVTFVEASTSGALIISQYYEGTSNNKWIEIYNPGSSAIDLAAGGYRLAQFSNTNREAWKIDGAANLTVTLSNTISAGGTYLVSHGSAALPTYVVADQTAGLVHNGDDTTVLYTGATYAFANVVDAMGWTATSGAADRSFVRTNTVTVGVNTDFNAAEWIEFSNAAVDAAAEGTNERLGYHSTGAAVFSVSFDKTTGFTVEQGSSAAITATAANGTAPYGYAWSSTLGGAFYSAAANVFTILATAPTGSYSAQVVATDNAAQSVTNSLNFSVQAPATKYAITITPPVNGTVTTTPATEAAAGTTVTINATAANGYAIDTYSVVGADTTVIGTTSSFTMPAQAVTVTVTFKVFTGSPLIFSEVSDPQDNANAKFIELYNAGGTAVDLAAGQWYLARQANGGTWANVALTGTVAPAGTYVIIYSASNFAAAYPTVTPDQTAGAVVTGNGDDGYFLYSGGNETAGTLQDAYGVLNEDGTGMAWEYTDGRAVRNTGVTVGNPTWTAGEWTITRPATAAEMTPGVHPDGAAVFAVTFDKTTGFTVEQGSSDAITATAANGTAPYSYAWSSTLGGAFYSAVANVFTILATAPTGTYSAQVVATDNAAQSVTNSLNFNVQAPAAKYAITITPPVNGTVTTTPATEAAAGATVTINATAAGGYAVGTKTVVGADLSPITVTGNTFTMPAQAVTVTVTFVAAGASRIVISQYTDTEIGTEPKGIELWNPTASPITFDATANLLTIKVGVNGALPTALTNIASGTLAAGAVWVIGTTNMSPDIVRAFTFNGDDAIVIELGGVVQDVFGMPGVDPGAAWSSNGVSTADQNIQLKTGITTGDLDGWTDPSERFETVGAGSVLTGFGVPPEAGGPSVSITGDLTGTVGVQMNLTITLLNGTAADWILILLDPDGAEVTVYNWNAGTGAFSFTPAKVGTYALSATAQDGGGADIASTNVTLQVSSGEAPAIPPITFVAGVGFSFTLPEGTTLNRVEGADTLVGMAWNWATLSAPTDYTISGSTITILRAPALKRMIRIWVQ